MRAAIVAHPRIAPLKPAALRALQTTDPVRFFAREALQRRGTARYQLRRAPNVAVVLRHATPDVETFDQVFLQESVAEPPPVRERLEALRRPPRILDLGANVGVSAAWFAARWPGAHIVCVEPDPANVAVLELAVAASPVRWRLVPAAAAFTAGELRFRAGRYAVSRAADPAEADAISVPAIDALALIEEERCDLVKLDIEGGEWAILADPRLAELPIVALALEFHPHLCPSCDARRLAHDLLERAGFIVLDVAHVRAAPPDEGSLWAWR